MHSYISVIKPAVNKMKLNKLKKLPGLEMPIKKVSKPRGWCGMGTGSYQYKKWSG